MRKKIISVTVLGVIGGIAQAYRLKQNGFSSHGRLIETRAADPKIYWVALLPYGLVPGLTPTSVSACFA